MQDDRGRRLPQRLGRADFLKLGALAAGTGIFAACGGADEEVSESRPPAPASQEAAGTSAAASPPEPPAEAEPAHPPIEDESGDLLVFEWAGYEVKPLWRAYRQKFPDDKPKFAFLTSDDQAISKVAGGFTADLVHPCVGYVADWVELGVVQPFDPSLLSHFGELNSALVKAGQVNGEQYFIPADWGFSAPLYRADKVDPREDSWTLLYDERYEGKISWWDSFENLVIGGYVRGFADPWDMSDDELEIVKEDLVAAKPLVRNFWSSYTDLNTDLANGNVWIAYAWPDAWLAAKSEGLDVVYMEPKEGRLSWVCGFLLFASTENYHYAHEFVDAWISSETALWTLENYAYGHANTSVDVAALDPALVAAFGLDDSAVLQEPRAHIDRHVPRRRLYNKIWSEIKAA